MIVRLSVILVVSIACICCDAENGLIGDSEDVPENPATDRLEDPALDKQIASATKFLHTLFYDQLRDDGEPPEEGFFRDYYFRNDIDVLSYSSGLEAVITCETCGAHLEEAIAACKKAGAYGYAGMLMELKALIFGDQTVTDQVYSEWLVKNAVLRGELKAAVQRIESEWLYAEPAKCEDMALLQIAAAIEAGVPGVGALIEDKALFRKRVEREKAVSGLNE